MLIDADFKGLEILCAAYLSKDKVLYNELNNNIDLHTENQKRFKLPTKLIAKTLKFRIIYGGSAYAFAHDPEFYSVSTSEKYWQGIIDEYYSKYSGLYNWHGNLLREVNRTGQLVIFPTGRVYKYERDKRNEWPRTTILNYPVQGLGADLMAIARVSLRRRLLEASPVSKLVCTVHDSIVIDSPSDEVDKVCEIIKSVWKDIPVNFYRLFRSNFDLECRVAIKTGPNWGTMKEI